MTETYNIYYDPAGDFLEISFGEPVECYVEEIGEGIFVRNDEKNNLKSIGIIGFGERTKEFFDLLKKKGIEIPSIIKKLDSC